MYPCEPKSIFLFPIFQKEDPFEITCIHVSGTVHFSVCIFKILVHSVGTEDF